MVSSTPWLHFTPGKEPVPILEEAGGAPGSVWTGGNSRPHRDSIPERATRSQSLYRLSYRAHSISGSNSSINYSSCNIGINISGRCSSSNSSSGGGGGGGNFLCEIALPVP